MIFQAVLVYLLAINLLGFAAMGLDKAYAVRGARRISERSLIGLACWGGAAGALAGRRVFRHKTQHAVFGRALRMVLVSQAVALGAWALMRS